MDIVKCPHCGKDVELTEAIIHELTKEARDQEKEKQKAELEKTRAEARAEAEKEYRLKSEQEVLEVKKRTKELEESLIRERQERKKVEEEIREAAKKEAAKIAEEDIKLKLKEKDIQIEQIKKANDDIRKANEDLKQKLEQGSQQLQGEALELDLEERLKKAFPNDEFTPVPKGVEGGDIWQKVTLKGKVVGSILWETKRTKTWSNSWIGKLKGDAAKVNASQSIIVSQAIPTGSKVFDIKEGVWITSFEYAISLCRYLRILFSSISRVKSSISKTDQEWGRIRDYMMSDSFKNRMETQSYSVRNLRTLLDAERRSSQIRWKKQQTQIDKLEANYIEFYEDLKEIVPNLPEFKVVEANLLEGGEDNDHEDAVEQTLF